MDEKSRPGGTLSVENIGGISSTKVEFFPGITILEGRNATNRTSLLQGLMAVLGSNNVTIKGDEESGVATLELGDNTYTRTLSQQGHSVVTGGDPYLNDPEIADLFAFLLESNEARLAVARSENLRDIIMRPVDTDKIEAEIERLLKKRNEIQDELDEVENLKKKLPNLEEERSQLTTEIEEKRAQLEEKEAELDAADVNIEETREEKAELEEKLEKLRSTRSDLDDIRFDLETEEESLSDLNKERKKLKEELSGISDTPDSRIEEIDSKISRLRNNKQQLETEINDIQSVIGFNEGMIEGENPEVFEVLSSGDGSEELTDQLLPDDEVTCWTCGNTVQSDEINTTIDQLRQLSKDKTSNVRELSSEIEELTAEREELRQSKQQKNRIEDRLSELETEIEQSEQNIENLQERRGSMTVKIEEIEAEVDNLESKDYGDVLDYHKQANQIEYELGRLESSLQNVKSEIESIENRISEQNELESRLENVRGELSELRTKIERIEQDAVEQFNTHMGTVLNILEYENIDRIWLERVEKEVREGRRKVNKSIFELHVIRMTESGTAYEDTVTHLSESEREVTGLVFALAGYLAHELYEDVPFMILDSLEAIDNERIADLVNYFSDYTGYLFVALLPENAERLDEPYSRISDI